MVMVGGSVLGNGCTLYVVIVGCSVLGKIMIFIWGNCVCVGGGLSLR